MPDALPVIDETTVVNLVQKLMAIPGLSGQERPVVDFVKSQLLAAGANEADIEIEPPPAQSPVKGEVGGLIFKLPGTFKGPRRLLMAHLDTVPICVGCEPIRDGQFLKSAKATTGLGADDRAGVATILHAAMTLLREKLPHPPLTFYWPVQEEIGLYGARNAKLTRLAKPKLGFNWDGGPSEKMTIGANGGYRLAIEVHGLASHAGVAPERGVSAIGVAGLAIADLVQNGWHGQVCKGKQSGTSNIGIIKGGDATNVVTDYVYLKAEARSHNPKFRERIVRAIEKAFNNAAKQVKNVLGQKGTVKIDGRLDYEAFRMTEDSPCVATAAAAIRSGGGEPFTAISNGGLDANWMFAHGLPTVTMGCGQMNPHMASERLDIAEFKKACAIALRIATGREDG